MPEPVPNPPSYDPGLIPAFDFTSPEFAAARTAILEGDEPLPINDAQVARVFERGFAAARARLAEAWAAQQAVEEHQRAQIQQQRAAELAARAAEEEAERRERERKRPKMPAISRGRTIHYDSRPPLSPFAAKRLEKFEYVPLWYFTKEAGLEARRESTARVTNPSETFSLTRSVGNGISIQAETNDRPSARQKRDRDLTFAELTQAQLPFLRALAEHRWSQEVIDMWAEFLAAILDSDFQFMKPLEAREAALMLHLDKTRARWHEAFAQDDVILEISSEIDIRAVSTCFEEVRFNNDPDRE